MNKQERKEKYNQIREMYEPIGKAKDYAMKQMIKTGKRMGRMRYLMLAVLFLFLFTYHFTFAIFTQLKMREKMARALALAMSAILAFTSVDVTVFAAAKLQEQKEEQNEAQKEGQDSVLIVGLEDLEENVRHQTLPLGAAETDIVFPATLSASVLKSDTEQLETEEPVPEEVEEQPEVGEEELETGEGEEEPGTGAGGENQQPGSNGGEKVPEAGDENQEPGAEDNREEEAGEENQEPGAEDNREEEAGEGNQQPEAGDGTEEGTGAGEKNQEPDNEERTEEPDNGEENESSDESPDNTEVSDAGNIVTDVVDILFPAMSAYAAEPENMLEENVEIPVTWELDTEKSSESAFSAEIEGAVFVYTPHMPERYTLSEEVILTDITVIIQSEEFPFEEAVIVDGMKVIVTADPGVFPAGAKLQVSRISTEEELENITDALCDAQAKEDAENRNEEEAGVLYDTEIVAFDITILNDAGEEIQPDNSRGEVTVKFENLSIEEGEDAYQQMFCVSDGQEVELLDTQTDVEEKSVHTQAQHFSVYGAALYTKAASSGTVSADTNFDKSAEELISVLIAGDEDIVPSGAKKKGTVYTFSNGTQQLGMNSGIVLDTSGSRVGDNDAQLDSIRDSKYSYGGHTSSLEFTSIANGDLLTFNYVFASSEFNQSPSFNDLFGLFVKVNNGSWQNIAKITRNNGSQVPVNIVNIRAGKSGTEMNKGMSTNLSGSHSLFSRKTISINGGSTNGVSNVFTASLPVKPGDNVTIKFAICDMSDTACNSYVFIEGNSLSFQGPKKTLKYVDKNGQEQTIEVEEGETVTAPEAPSKDGYTFLGWNTRQDGTGNMYQPGDEFPLTENTRLYPMWDPIKNTAKVNLILDEVGWKGQKVQLYQNGVPKYILSPITGEEGAYQNALVINGSYDVYVNGRKTDKSFSFDAKKVSLYDERVINYKNLQIQMNLDDSPSTAPGEVTLRQNHAVVFTVSSQNGIYKQPILECEGTFDIFVDGTDTDFDVSFADTDKEIDFYTARVKINDDEVWTDAKVELRTLAGNMAAVLSAGERNGNSVIYEKILQKDEASTLSLYVDNRDVRKKFVIKPGACYAELDYYMATVSISDNVPSPKITMTNGVENYTFQKSGEVYEAHHVLIHQENEEELRYTVEVVNTIDNVKETVYSGRKSVELQYHKVEYRTVNSDDTERLFHTVYVRHGSTMPAYTGNVKLSAFTFSHWSETKWTIKDKVAGEPFDYSGAVGSDLILYANFTTPTVTIGELVYTDENGNLGGKGTYYRMGNLTISGFEPGDQSIKYIYLTTTNTESITLLNTSGLTVTNGTTPVSVNGGSASFVPTEDKVAVIFDNSVSMAAAQDYLRSQVVVKPKTNAEHIMIVEVTDKGGNYVGANAVTSSQTSETVGVLGESSYGQTLSSGMYFVTSSISCTNSKTGGSGITITNGATVYIYIKKGCTLTATGAAGSGRTGGGAGIHVPSGATLYLLGEGTVNATGGAAAKGGDGKDGGKGTRSGATGTSGYGGAGGDGGGGAGAGIGTPGGAGGSGGSKRDGITSYEDTDRWGYNGNSGSDGDSALSMGTLYVDGVEIEATGGSSAGNGNKGNAGKGTPAAGSSDVYNKDHYRYAGGGGGGGAGAGGGSAQKIGTGGQGGAGGGGGGVGGILFAGSGNYLGEDNNPNAQGGEGGMGPNNVRAAHGELTERSIGRTELIPDINGTYWGGSYGGSGGSSGGGSGSTGSAISCNPRTYSITFTTPSETAKKPSDSSYYVGVGETFTLPAYEDSNTDVNFLGWQIANYAKSNVTGSPCTNPGIRYEQGETITLDETTVGNISFVAVTETVSGVRDNDTIKTTIEVDKNTPNITYYTYHVTLETDGVITPKGTIQIGDKSVAPSKDGTYTLIATEQVKKGIQVNGEIVGETSGFGLIGLDHTSETTVDYETLKVEVYGKEPNSVTLSGTNAPALINRGNENEPYEYSIERLAGLDKGLFGVLVDGEDTGVTASYGKTAKVTYHTLTVHVNTIGLEPSEINTVELRDASGQFLSMNGNGTADFTCVRLKSDTQYTIYINGEKTEATADFSDTRTVNVEYCHYTTLVKTQLDGTLVDMGTVRLGEIKLIRIGTGTYQLITTDHQPAPLSVDGKVVSDALTPGTTKVVNYYTLTYAMSGESEIERGNLPEDHTWYLEGTKAKLLGNIDLVNGGKTFVGWKLETTTYQAGTEAVISGTTIAKAAWKATPLSEAVVEIEDTDFVYNKTSQTPEITVTRNNTTLKKGKDYQVSYQNTNSSNGLDSTNTINAGTITITLSGIGDYSGTVTGSYEIKQKGIVVTDLKAKDRIYDGTLLVEMDGSQAVLSGVEDGDDVTIAVAEYGKLENPDAGSGKIVMVNNGNITGAAVSNYELRPSKAITVEIEKKPLTAEMFTVPETEYNASEQTPKVTASDIAVINNQSVNRITAGDYSISYQNNVHAGEGMVVLSGQNNYTGTVSVPFTIRKAPIEIEASSAQSTFGQDITDVSGNYTISSGTIFSDQDKEDLAIKAVTSVKKGYDAKTYQNAVTIQYNKGNTDYEVTTKAADYIVQPAGTIPVIAAGYTGVYNGKYYSIQVTPQPELADDTIKIYYSTTQKLTAENVQSLVNSKQASETKPVFKDAGEYIVYYYVASNNYAGCAGSKTVKITKAEAVVTANLHTITYGEKVSEISDTQSEGSPYPGVTITGLVDGDTIAQLSGLVSYTSNDYEQFDDVGTYTLTPEGLSSANYDITYRAGTLNVAPKTVTFSWSDVSGLSYTGMEQSITATIQGLENGDQIGVVYETKAAVGKTPASCHVAVQAGTYLAKVQSLQGSKAANYTFAENGATVSKEWSIAQAENQWTINPSIQGWTVGETGNDPVGAAKFGTGNILYTYATKPEDSETPVYSASKPTDAGVYLMKAFVPGTEDYQELSLAEPVSFTIAESAEGEAKPTVYVIPEYQEITYGGEITSVPYLCKDKNGNTVLVQGGEITGEAQYRTSYQKGDPVRGNVGEYTLTIENLSSTTYQLVFKPGTLKVIPKEVELSWSKSNLTYTGQEQSVTASVNAESLINGDSVSVEIYQQATSENPSVCNTAVQVGNYTAKALSLTGKNAGNYKLPENAEYSWKIEKATNEFVIQPAMDGWYYGQNANVPVATAKFGTVTFRYQEVKDGISDWTIFNPKTNQVPTQVGTYRLIAEVEAGEGYDAISSNETTFTISPAEVMITAKDAESTYGVSADSTLYYSLAVLKGKLTEEDKASLNIGLQVDVTDRTPVGTYPITVTTTANSNIKVQSEPGVYTVRGAELIVAASDVEVTYDGRTHGMEAPQITTVDGRKVTDAEVYYSTTPLSSQNYGSGTETSPTITNVGELMVHYYVTAENHTPATGSCKVTVKPKEVTVTAKNTSITYGEAAKNEGVTYQGFVGEDTEESLRLVPVYTYVNADDSSTYTQGSPVGTYQIVPGGLSAENYQFSYVPGSLTVERKPLSENMFTLAQTQFDYGKVEQKPSVSGTDRITAAGGTQELLEQSDYTVDYINNINAGENTATAVMKAADSGNYSGEIRKYFSIHPKAITVSANPAESDYHQPVAELSYQITSGEVYQGDDLNLSAVTSVKKGYDAGTYEDAVTISYDRSNTNYVVTTVPADYTVKRASLTVTADPYTGTYDGKKHSAEISAKTGQFLTFAKIYYSAERTVDKNNYTEMSTDNPSFTNAGTYTVYYYAVCDNYEPVQGSVQVVIDQAPLTVTAPSRELTYGESPVALMDSLKQQQETENRLTIQGLVGSDGVADAIKEGSNIVFSTNYEQYGKVGTYKLSASGVQSDNYKITYRNGSLTVNPKTITFTWPENRTFTYNGNEQGIQAVISGKAKETDDVRVGSYVADQSQNISNQATAAGEYTAKVNALIGNDAGNYTFDAEEESSCQTWSISKAANSFTMEPAINSWTEGNEASLPYAAAKYGNVVFTYSTEENGSYQSELPNNGQAGTYWMKASVAETANYEALEKKISFEILSLETPVRTITITVKQKNIVYGDAFRTSSLSEGDLSITGLTVEQSLSDVAEGTVNFATDYTQGDGAGTYLLVPSGLVAKAGYEISYQPGNLVVSKKTISLNWGEDIFTYDGSEHCILAEVNIADLYGDDSIQVTGYEYNKSSKVQNTAVDAGDYTAHVISFSGNNWNNYVLSSQDASHSWTIKKAVATAENPGAGNQFTVAPSIADWTYGDNPSTPHAEAKFGTPVYQYAELPGGPYTDQIPETAGSWYMQAVVEESDNYEKITSDPVPFEIRKSSILITADDITSPYGEALAELTYTISGTVKTGDDLGIVLETTASRTAKVGEYPITITHRNNANYQIELREGTYFITAAANKLQVTASGYTGVYDGEAHGITVEVKDLAGNTLSDATVYYSESELTDSNYGTGSLTSPTITEVGTKTIYYYVASDNFQAVTGSKEIVVSKKDVVLKAENARIIYGEEPVNNGITYTGFIQPDTAESLGLSPTYKYNYVQYQDAGSYRITPVLSDTRNYHFIPQTGVLTVDKKPVSFEWSEDSFVYDGTKKQVKADVIGTVNYDVISVGAYEENVTQNIQNGAIDVGDYTAIVASLAGEKAVNYIIEAEEETASHGYSITSGTNYFTVMPSIDSWTYGETASVPKAESAYGSVQFVYSDRLYGTYTSQKPSEVGNYFMKAKSAATGNYGSLESEAVPFSVKKAKISIMAEDKFGRLGEALQDLTYTITGNEIAGETLEVTIFTEAQADSPVGSYPIHVTVDAGEHYDVTTVGGAYHIIDQEVTIEADGVTTAYDGKYHGITVTVKDAGGETPENISVYYSDKKLPLDTDFETSTEVSRVSPTRRDVGSLTVYYYIKGDGTTEENESGDGFVISGSKVVTITKVPLLVTAKNVTIVKGDAPKNNGVTYEGFIENENETFLSGTLSYAYNYVKGQPDGSYQITPSGLLSPNYEITYKAGTLTVLPLQEELAILGVLSETNIVYDGEPHKGYLGIPKTQNDYVTEFEVVYKDGEGNELSEKPVNAGSYKVIIKIPEDNLYYKGRIEIPFTIAKKKIVVKAWDQAILAGQQFKPVAPDYIGFIGEDNKDNCINSMGTTAPEAGSDLGQVGTVTLKVTSKGELSERATGNYKLAEETLDGILTILPVATGSEEENSTGGSLVLDPNAPNSGTVQTAVIKNQEELPKTKLETNLSVPVVEELLTDEEIGKVKNDGKNALIYLVLSDVNESEYKDEVQAIKEKAESLDENMEVGVFLDLSLFKKVGDETPEKITETGSTEVTVYVTLPDSLKQMDETKTRTYYIIYEHNGHTYKINPTLEGDVLSFTTNQFSTYAIAYIDIAKQNGGGGSGTGNNPEDGNNPGKGHSSAHGSDSGEESTENSAVSPDAGENPEENSSGGNGSPDSGKNPGKDDGNSSGSKAAQNDNSTQGNENGNDTNPDTETPDSETPEEAEPDNQETLSAEPTDDVPTEIKKQLKDALEEIQKLDPSIIPGPYVQAKNVENITNPDGTETITLDIPEDLRKDGRHFYLMMVDQDGNVIVLSNESLEDGTISITGDPNATYQLIYEDGKAVLTDMISENGMLMGANGKLIKVSTNHCFWHWLMLIVAILGLAAVVISRKRKEIWLFVIASIVFLIIFAVLGSCSLDWIFTIAGSLILLVVATLFRVRIYQAENAS